MCDPVGIVEIADRLEVSRHTVHKWRQRRVMPEPRWTVGGGPCWDWPDVQVWAFHSRRRGRGPDKGVRVGSLKPVGEAKDRETAEWIESWDGLTPTEQAAERRAMDDYGQMQHEQDAKGWKMHRPDDERTFLYRTRAELIEECTKWGWDPDDATPTDWDLCPRCGLIQEKDATGAFVEHQLPPGRVRHDGSTLCPGAP